MFQAQFDRLVAFVSEPEFSESLVAGKKHYFDRTGEVFEEDDAFEMRMSSFLDWFIFDHKLPGTDRTAAELFVERHGTSLDPAELTIYRNFAHTVHSLFEVGRLKPDTVHVKDLFSGKSHAVFERRKPAGVDSGDLLEARLVTTPESKLMFSPAFCFHPREAKKVIAKAVKAHKKAGTNPQELIFKLAYLRLKLDRYKHVAPVKIYEEGAAL